MMTLFPFLLSLFLFPSSPATTSRPTATDEITWKTKRKLTWEDFRATADSQDPLHALTATNIDMKAKCEDGKLKIKVKSLFSTRESWSKNKQSDRLLFHEQLHFDITEIYARKLRKELSSLKNACEQPEQLNKVTDQVFDDWKKQEELYDQETIHGLDANQMETWRKRVDTELKSLEAYKED